MSRNLGRTDCQQCGGPIEFEESPRLITEANCGDYFREYQGMYVANAHCVYCQTKYLAWYKIYNLINPWMYDFSDLSYRESFDNEPGDGDVDIVRVAWVQQKRNELDQLLRNGPEQQRNRNMKLRQLVAKALQQRTAHMENLTQDTVTRLVMSYWLDILDELSDDVYKIAGNGLPIQGQRRIAKLLGITVPEALDVEPPAPPPQACMCAKCGDVVTPDELQLVNGVWVCSLCVTPFGKKVAVGAIVRQTYKGGFYDIEVKKLLMDGVWEGTIVDVHGRREIGDTTHFVCHPNTDGNLLLVRKVDDKAE